MTKAPPSNARTQMADRTAAITAFLQVQGWQDAAITPLSGDASFRRYLILDHARFGRALLMDAPPQTGEDCRPFVAVNDWLRGHGFSAPEIYAADLQNGFLILEDLGQGLFADLVADDPALEPELYSAATRLLAQLHTIAPPASLAVTDAKAWPLAPYDAAELKRETNLLIDWYWPLVRGEDAPVEVREDYEAAWQGAFAAGLQNPPVFVHRDYHAQNLIWLPDRDGHARVGLLDHQDALAGHAGYDLASLLEDARRDVPSAIGAQMIKHYCDERSTLDAHFDANAWRAGYDLLAAQRNAKIIGIFARLAVRDNKPAYLPLIGRVWHLLSDDLTRNGLADVQRWFDQHWPEDQRVAP